MTMASRDTQLNVSDRVARITLSRPPLNILTISMMKEITAAVQRVGAMSDVCAIVLAASPSTRAFSAGTSVEEHRPETVFQMLEAFHSIFRAIDAASKPVIALVAGAALGGGCELVAFADIVIATQSARFGQPEIKLGVFPPISACILPGIIGEKKARELILTGELMTADEARALGLVNHVVPELELEAKAAEILAGLKQLSVPALELARRAITDARGRSFEEALKRAEDLYLNNLMSHKDPVEGVQAFIDKRPPNWKHK
jgi:cyclohexa-1,5-dienecarbonyl-CoA hydratase